MKFAETVLSTLSATALGLMALGLSAAPAQASVQTATTTFQVTATVQATCTISATTMGFGTYTGVVAPSTSTITTTCTNTTPYTVGLSAGLGTLATVTARSMTGPASAQLNYGLYSDSAHSVNFATTANITGNGSGQAITVYGQIPVGQYVAPGTYTDTITATVTY